ncbi:MATE family efflux transporter [Aquimarina agarilytica]|uniref:MATE family efflux transporter n=1 Tax=Aquimarina agarilytica TaxID=1087449 RepID=UPI00028922AF|nr:MATE family efflux transporter [Aquimarina agarilytica]
MAKTTSTALGSEPIGSLLLKQAIPAAIGILVMSLNILVDSIFVGKWVGPIAIAAINVVLPVSFFIAAIGMAIGIGGSSVLSRALGAKNYEKAIRVFGNQTALTLVITLTLISVGLIFTDSLVHTFGGKGAIFDLAKDYYRIVLYGVPILALAMMGNTVIRAEGKPKHAMIAMIIPSVANLFLDYLFINVFGWGMIGAGWATTASYICCFSYIFYFFFAISELRLQIKHLKFNIPILKEIAALGSTTLARQGVISIVYLILNNIMVDIEGEWAVACYAIVSRLLMFALFPIIGITQGFLPIASYNYGAQEFGRVKQVIYTAIIYATGLGIFILGLLFLFPEPIAQLFLSNSDHISAAQKTINNLVLNEAPRAIRFVFAASPIIAIQLIGSAYFQAVGKAIPALLLSLSKQGFFLIPLLLILPKHYGILGVWISFPISDTLSTIATGFFLNKEIKTKLNTKPSIISS